MSDNKFTISFALTERTANSFRLDDIPRMIAMQNEYVQEDILKPYSDRCKENGAALSILFSQDKEDPVKYSFHVTVHDGSDVKEQKKQFRDYLRNEVQLPKYLPALDVFPETTLAAVTSQPENSAGIQRMK